MTNQEVEQIKRHVDEAFQGLRGEISEFRRDAAAAADHLMQELVETRKNAGAEAEQLRSEIRAVAEGVALANERINDVDLRVDRLGDRVDNLTGEVRRGLAGVRAEIHHLHETDDELRRRIEAQEQRGA